METLGTHTHTDTFYVVDIELIWCLNWENSRTRHRAFHSSFRWMHRSLYKFSSNNWFPTTPSRSVVFCNSVHSKHYDFVKMFVVFKYRQFINILIDHQTSRMHAQTIFWPLVSNIWVRRVHLRTKEMYINKFTLF